MLPGRVGGGPARSEAETKALIVIAAQEDGMGIGRIRMRHIADASAESLHPFVKDFIAPGSVVHTDGGRGYAGLGAQGYTHQVTVLKGKKESASELLPRVGRGGRDPPTASRG